MNARLVKFVVRKESLLHLSEDVLGNCHLVSRRLQEPGAVDAEGEELSPGDLLHDGGGEEGLDPGGPHHGLVHALPGLHRHAVHQLIQAPGSGQLEIYKQ